MSKNAGIPSNLIVSERETADGLEAPQHLAGDDIVQQESGNSGSHLDEGSEDAGLRNVEGSVSSKSKDAGKRKRASKTAKLKQCKLDARQKQWLSSVNAGNRRQGPQSPAPTASLATNVAGGCVATVCASERSQNTGEQHNLPDDIGKHEDASNPTGEEHSCHGIQSLKAERSSSSPGFCVRDSNDDGKPALCHHENVGGELNSMMAASSGEAQLQYSPLNLSREMLERTELASELTGSLCGRYEKETDVELSTDLEASRENFQKLDPAGWNGLPCRSRTATANGSRNGTGRSQGGGSYCGGKRGVVDGSVSPCSESCAGSTSASSCANSCAGSSGAGSGSDDNDETNGQRNNGGHHRNAGFGQSLKGDSEVDDWEALYVVPEENEKQSEGASDNPAKAEGGKAFVGKDGTTNSDTAVRDVSLKPDYKYHGNSVGSQMRSQGPPRAWRPDDISRPPTLPRLAKQHSYPMHAAAPWGGAFNGSVWGLQPPAPEYCPVCTEEMDTTDASFLPCSCGFRICLFCHHRIVLGDGRCPGCRKAYATTEVKLSRSPSLWLRPNRGAPLLS
eukprot:TRINITY_DN19722_c0_g2_i1.p1 TRINITY_DN19722_c0_g2~~TRINITY_DN19722_c0_g2_i1.p1  ORF type:complete len:564 (-),score=101.51 TRINITY_DN19722_c0_g2_i1:55-1746(-)